MANVTHYSIFYDWLFDGDPKSEIPTNEPNILKYDSPINETFILKIFMKHAEFNHYLNQNFNNIIIRNIEREDLLKFIKQCVFDFKLRRNNILYSPPIYKTKLVKKLKLKLPLLKDHEISFLADQIEHDPNKDSIYSSLGLEKPEKKVIKKKTKEVKTIKVSFNNFIDDNFKFIEI